MNFFKSFLFFSLIFFPSLTQNVDGYNILFLHSIGTKSHRTSIWPLAEKLADVGHNVTYIFPVDKMGTHPKIREIVPSKVVPIVKNFVSDFDIRIKLEDRVNEWLSGLLEASIQACGAFFESPEIQDWLSEPDLQFDLIFIEANGVSDFAYGLVYKFKAKHIMFSPLMYSSFFDDYGVVPETSSVPDLFFPGKPDKLGLFQRMIATAMPLVWKYNTNKFRRIIHPVVQEGLKLNDLPPLEEFVKNTSLILVNDYFVENYPVASPAFFQSYSGLWCSKEKLKAPRKLPEDISKFVDGGEGFFYVSLGSAVVASAMPISLRDEFFTAFRALPTYRFLWRWTGPVPDDTPENVLLLPWFPQLDVLAHPKLKGFLTQTGLPSTQEALCRGVPLITLPIMGDQQYNADRLEYLQASINLDIMSLTSADLQNSFKEIIGNPMYRNKMKELSAVFRDRPVDPLEQVYFWTEFVMRHDASVLKPLGMNQTWYQRRLLDVYAAFLCLGLVIALVFVIVVYAVTKFSLKMFCKLDVKGKTEYVRVESNKDKGIQEKKKGTKERRVPGKR